jgi:hypothetical protein
MGEPRYTLFRRDDFGAVVAQGLRLGEAAEALLLHGDGT